MDGEPPVLQTMEEAIDVLSHGAIEQALSIQNGRNTNDFFTVVCGESETTTSTELNPASIETKIEVMPTSVLTPALRTERETLRLAEAIDSVSR